MKRDMELVRQILLTIEQGPPMDKTDVLSLEPGYLDIEYEPDLTDYPDHEHTLPDDERFTSQAIYRREIISSHIQLLHEAGLIEARGVNTNWGREWRPYKLTWNGHEFVDASRDEKVWRKALKTVGDKAGSIPFSVLQQLLIKLAAASFGLDT